jgi:hypothetical protein
MTSQINPNNIDGSYPVAGQDNDSQGFRDNFTNIRNNFTFTKAELEDLQNKVVLKSALLNTTLSNDFVGNVIANPALSSYRETYTDIGAPGSSATVNFVNGNFQKITMSSSLTLAFSFPVNTSGQFASIKLWVVNTDSSRTLTLPAAVSLNGPLSIGGAAGSPITITFTADEIANNTNYLFEFYTVNGGTSIGIIDHTRNRDIALTALAVSGSFSANGSVTLGSGTSSNVVVAASTRANNSTTGALVVSGGAAIGGNAFVNGNLIINNGIINPDYLLANVVTGQNLFANVNFNRFIANCSPTGTVANLFITLPDSVEDGREIDITSMTAITSCYVSNMTPAVDSVYGLANNWSASASLTNSVSIKLLYNASVGRWFKVG